MNSFLNIQLAVEAEDNHQVHDNTPSLVAQVKLVSISVFKL